MVEMVAAYVDGRPMPCSSSALMSVASVKRGGGSVKCWVVVTSVTLVVWPSASSGRRASASSSSVSSSRPSVYTREKPSNRVRVADARSS